MRKRWCATVLLAAISLLAAGQQAAPPAAPPPLKLKVGDTVPDFTLRYFDGTQMKDISLHDYKGKKNVLLAFFIFAFTSG